MEILNIVPVLHTMYFIMLVRKLIKSDIRCNVWNIWMYVLNAVCSQVLFTLEYYSMALVFTVGGLYLHWTYLPQQQLSAANKAILITGCSRGIGHALAKKLDSLGYQVFAGCLSKGQIGAQTLVSACSNRLVTLQLDVTDREQIQQAVLDVKQHLGNNRTIELMSIEDIDNVMATNYFGPVDVCRAFLPLIRRSKGRLVNIGSNAGLTPVPHLSILSESLRYELDQWGVSVSTIVPSGYKTGILAYDKNAAADRWWKLASDTVKQDFGRECFTPIFKHENHEAATTTDLSPIVNTIITAISVLSPQPFYYSGFLARTLPFVYLYLPVVIREPIMKVIVHWFNFQPKALSKSQEKLPVNGNQEKLPVNEEQEKLPVNAEQDKLPVNGEREKRPVNGQQKKLPFNGEQEKLPVNGEQKKLFVDGKQKTIN